MKWQTLQRSHLLSKLDWYYTICSLANQVLYDDQELPSLLRKRIKSMRPREMKVSSPACSKPELWVLLCGPCCSTVAGLQQYSLHLGRSHQPIVSAEVQHHSSIYTQHNNPNTLYGLKYQEVCVIIVTLRKTHLNLMRYCTPTYKTERTTDYEDQ